MPLPEVTVYTTDRCSRCASAKSLLDRRGILYDEINLSRDPDGRSDLHRRTGMLTFPQIVIGDHTLGGFEDLLAADQGGQLTALQSP
jgi:glutaredoxin 3